MNQLLANSALPPDHDTEIVLTTAEPKFEICSMKNQLFSVYKNIILTK
ncbi:hypothetical protein K4T59_11010 [Staphylococcus epidermidis]|nr:hypothetical protein [Staphylococcus epidermidis]